MPIDKKELEEALECMEMKCPCVVHDALRDRECAVIIAIALRESQAQVRAAEKVVDMAECELNPENSDGPCGWSAREELKKLLAAYRAKYPEDSK